MYRSIKPLVLASNSPRRRHFLDELGLSFTVRARDIDETPIPGERPVDYVERMAWEKAEAVSNLFPQSYVLAADTAVCLGDMILGKPVDADDAVAMLLQLAGRVHAVRSGVCIRCLAEGVMIVRSVTTEVEFTTFDRQVAEAYVAEGESLDKAGGYGIQGKGSFLVATIRGSYTNVVGLPLAETVAILVAQGVICPLVPSGRSA